MMVGMCVPCTCRRQPAVGDVPLTSTGQDISPKKLRRKSLLKLVPGMCIVHVRKESLAQPASRMCEGWPALVKWTPEQKAWYPCSVSHFGADLSLQLHLVRQTQVDMPLQPVERRQKRETKVADPAVLCTPFATFLWGGSNFSCCRPPVQPLFFRRHISVTPQTDTKSRLK